MKKVAVLLPVYNSEKYIAECLDSVLSQTLTDWELYIINEFGSNKECTDIIREYEKKDKRIKVIQNETRLGLAESLNKGMRLAEAEYFARIDADDLAHKDRFEKQVNFMDKNPNVIVLGSYQHHFGKDTDWIHMPPAEKEQCKANFLFFCDICHSTLMLRRDVFINNNLFYDNHFLAEDFELWSRVIDYGDIANLPEVLGEYRVGEDNITQAKKERLHIESGHIVAKTVERTLGLEIPAESHYLFNNWDNDFAKIYDKQKLKETYEDLKSVLKSIYDKNAEVKYFDDQALLRVIRAKYFWAKHGEPFNRMVKVHDFESIFKDRFASPKLNRLYYFWKDNKGIIKKLKKIWKKLKEYFS